MRWLNEESGGGAKRRSAPGRGAGTAAESYLPALYHGRLRNGATGYRSRGCGVYPSSPVAGKPKGCPLTRPGQSV